LLYKLDLSLSWLGIGISVESGGVKLGSSPTKPLPDFTIYMSNTTGEKVIFFPLSMRECLPTCKLRH
jgi:hypothetical protein